MRGVSLKLLDPTGMGLAHVYGVTSQVIDDLEVLPKHVRVLVIFGGYVFSYSGR